MSSLLAALAGALLWSQSGFVHGMLLTSSDPELILGVPQGLQAPGLMLLIAAGVNVARTLGDAQRGVRSTPPPSPGRGETAGQLWP